ncbi:hypothetical protein WG926_15340 [Tistrella sp. BH-R2-4]|uniref:Uncharacterized protein n=1 Tax=Tistrella arctica TaxID=3133430 RepID=A0ABU9YLL0_9PROT
MPTADFKAGLSLAILGLTPDKRTAATDIEALRRAAADDLPIRASDAFLDLAVVGLGPAADSLAFKPSRIIGPFRDPAGGRFLFDVFDPATLTPITPKGQTQPILLVSSGSARQLRGEVSFRFGAGSIWLAAGLFSAKAPADGYAGLRITGGNARFKAAGPVGTTIAAPPVGQITLDLDAPPMPADPCQDAVITPPAKLVITIDGGTVTVALDGGGADLAGTHFAFDPADRVVWSPDDRGLWFTTTVTPAVVDAKAIDWRVAEIDGRFTVARAGWLLPVATGTAPQSLPEASGAGHWLMALRGAARVRWSGLDGGVAITDPRLTIGAGRFLLTDRDARADAGSAMRLGLWPLMPGAGPGRQPLVVDLPAAPMVVIGCVGHDRHIAATIGVVGGVLSRPVDHRGRPVAMAPTQVVAMVTRMGDDTRIDLAGTAAAGAAAGDLRLVVENALLHVTPPLLQRLAGVIDAQGDIAEGTLDLIFGVANWLPTLPDPYVSSCFHQSGRMPGAAAGTAAGAAATPMKASCHWAMDAAATVGFSATLDLPALACNPASQGGSRPYPKPSRDQQPPLPGQTAAGTGLRGRDEAAAWAAARKRAHGAGTPDNRSKAENAWVSNTGDISRRAGVALLDVSTARHQIGVEFEAARPVLTHADPLGQNGFMLDGLRVKTRLRVFALPQIQWEPVRTLDADQDLMTLGYFPTPLASASDGGRAVIAGRQAVLRVAIPDLALDDLVAGFEAGDPLDILTTLPFGIRARLALKPAADGASAADTARFTRPRFDHGQPLTGGLQLTLRAGTPTATAPRESAGFQGIATQTANGVDLASGAPLNISVLGATLGPDAAVEAMFNNEFTLHKPRVPVTRLDLSGYGSSSFSDWGNPFAAFAEAAKVQFQVMVGRTALEVVKFVSVIYPWGIRATRTVTIERQGGGGVLRRDSGWQAASAGLFDFRRQPAGGGAAIATPYDIHPGLIRGLYDVGRIRPADRPSIGLPGGGRVQPMYFDCTALIGTNAADTRTPARGMLGYLHLEPVGAPISPDDLDQLLATYGAPGGPVDVSLPLDTTGFRCRIRRIEAAPSRDAGSPVVVGALRGTPHFGSGNGAWSVAAFPGPGDLATPPDAAPVADGVAILRAGEAGVPQNDRVHVPAPAAVIRFQDPRDLFAGAAPLVDYAFIQTTPTHSFAFRRPQIGIGGHDITAGLPALLADVFARSGASGIFPPPDATITLGGAGSYRLRVNPANGLFRLMPPVAMVPGALQIMLSDDADASTRIDYGESAITLTIDEAAWSLDMPRLKLWTDMLGLTDVTGMRASIIGGSHQTPRLVDIASLMHPVLDAILTFLPGFTGRPDVAPIDLAATNVKYKAKLKTVAEKEVELGPLHLKVGAVFEAGTDEVDIPPDLLPPGSPATEAEVSFVGGGISLGLDGSIPLTPWMVVYGAEFGLGGKTYMPSLTSGPGGGTAITGTFSKASFELKAYIGFGLGGRIGPFKAEVSVGIGPIIVYEGDWGFGGFVFFDAKVDLKVITVGVYGEFSLMIVKKADADYAKYEGEVGIYAKVLFFSIKVSVGISHENEI